MTPGSSVLFRVNDDPMSRARAIGEVVAIEEGVVTISCDDVVYERPLAECVDAG